MKSKIILSLIAFTFIFSCQKDKSVQKESATTEVQSTENTLDIQSFEYLPELGECFTYIAKSKEDYNAQKFIYADDYGNQAYVKIGEEMKNIPLEEGDFDPSDNSRKIKWEGGKVFMEIIPIKEESTDEEVIFEGAIKIQIDGKIYQTAIYGKYSC